MFDCFAWSKIIGVPLDVGNSLRSHFWSCSSASRMPQRLRSCEFLPLCSKPPAEKAKARAKQIEGAGTLTYGLAHRVSRSTVAFGSL
jgi:hypothetical protein